MWEGKGKGGDKVRGKGECCNVARESLALSWLVQLRSHNCKAQGAGAQGTQSHSQRGGGDKI
jgi:hypothetical protein